MTQPTATPTAPAPPIPNSGTPQPEPAPAAPAPQPAPAIIGGGGGVPPQPPAPPAAPPAPNALGMPGQGAPAEGLPNEIAVPLDPEDHVLQLQNQNAQVVANLTASQAKVAEQEKELADLRKALGETRLESKRHETIARRFTRRGIEYEGELAEVRGLQLGGESGIEVVGADGNPVAVGEYTPPRLVRLEPSAHPPTPPNQPPIPQQSPQVIGGHPQQANPQAWDRKWQPSTGPDINPNTGKPNPQWAV